MKIAKRILCEGRVQGVYFRASTKEKANSLHINGWVKNQKDGTVLIHAEGDEEQVQMLVDWCNRGPEHAKVASVQVQDTQIENFQSFRIIH